MPSGPEADIDELAAVFFGSFDNRDGRRPNADTLRKIFAQGAIAIRLSPEGRELMDVEAFIEPRVDLLVNGGLTEFHEWETEWRTLVTGNIATRISSYAKAGLLDGTPYRGTGRKILQLFRHQGCWLIASLLWEDD